MNKTFLLLSGLFLFCSIKATDLLAQTVATAGVFAIVVNTSNNAAQINYLKSASQNIQAENTTPEKVFQISSGDVNQTGGVSQNIASFSITGDSKNAFSVYLPTHPILLTNPKNGNTIQVSDWKTDSQPHQSDLKKNVWIINLDASLKMGAANNEKSGEYSGTYPVTMIYN
ncbi:MAG: DUF4402 domain-containing protein [Bacteroidota bacterium]|nr:DUF4402 domain-containing protein [Bacteroidota bacterium]